MTCYVLFGGRGARFVEGGVVLACCIAVRITAALWQVRAAAAAAAEMFRLLKPGGLAVLTVSVQLGDRSQVDSLFVLCFIVVLFQKGERGAKMDVCV
jgi:hypothetical protein